MPRKGLRVRVPWSPLMSHNELKDKIQQYINKPHWSDSERWEVVKILSSMSSDHRVSAMSCYVANDIERLRSQLCDVLKDFDILITNGKIVFQQKPQENWWHRNYGWLLGLITALCAVGGLLLKYFYG